METAYAGPDRPGDQDIPPDNAGLGEGLANLGNLANIGTGSRGSSEGVGGGVGRVYPGDVNGGLGSSEVVSSAARQAGNGGRGSDVGKVRGSGDYDQFGLSKAELDINGKTLSFKGINSYTGKTFDTFTIKK